MSPHCLSTSSAWNHTDDRSEAGGITKLIIIIIIILKY